MLQAQIELPVVHNDFVAIWIMNGEISGGGCREVDWKDLLPIRASYQMHRVMHIKKMSGDSAACL